jgi:ArsR family transcriptional regulator, lead/cadmium/zinc/bismuth-responsive transcriptional repressor
MHLVPPERRSQRVLDGERVCQAISAIGDPDNVAAWSQRFGLLSDANRLALLLCIHHAGPISVTDLAVATDMRDTTVSQTLRLLRANGTVVAERDGRVVRYALADADLGALLERVTSAESSAARFRAAHH